MKDFVELIDALYSEKLDTVATNKADSDLRARFVSYMEQSYGRFLEKLNANPQIKQNMLEHWYQIELRHWGYLSDDAKYAYFTYDAALAEIRACSEMVFSIARKKYNSGEVSNDDMQTAKNCVDKMKASLPNILIENENSAKWLLSEGIVDSNYICGVSKMLSLRLGDLSRYQKR